MSMDASLFGDDEPTPPAAAVPDDRQENLPAWQVEGLRKALDSAGVMSMSDRQRLVQDVVGRNVDALHDLLPREAAALRDELRRRTQSAGSDSSGSQWDERDGDTWIDRL
ncbi:hypothetical protein [Nocardioides aurantiacus]|uniref:hypothetical protein n=1 Tax=Nocardioides aurantiacus TaxID=86796 RepID=UPI00403F792A